MRNTILVAAVVAVSVWAMGVRADVKDDIVKASREVSRYGAHDYRGDIKAKVEAGIATYAKYANVTNCPRELGEFALRIIKAAAETYDTQFAKDFVAKIFDSDFGPDVRLNAARYLASGCAEKGDFASADAVYDKFLATPKLGANYYVWTWGSKARLKVLKNDRAGALAVLDRGLAAVPADARWRKDAERMFVDERAEIHRAFYDTAAAFQTYVKAGRRSDAMRLFERYGGVVYDDIEVARKLSKEMLADEKASFDDRLIAWTWLFNREPKFVAEHPVFRPGDGLKCTNAVVKALAYKLTRGQNYHLEGFTTAVAHYGNRTEVIHTWKEYLRLLAVVGGDPEFNPSEAATLAFAGEGDKAAAVAAAKRGLANEKLSSEERYELTLMSETLLLKGSADEIAAQLAKIEPKVAGDLDANKRLARLDRAGAAATQTIDENLMRGFAQYRAKVEATPPTKRYVVKFSNRPIAGAADWVNLPFKPEESAYDRKYGGGGAAFLVTDVATGDRGEAVKGGDGRTTLSVVADVWGVHILRTYHDKRAREFEGGFLDAGSFEEYIAPGDNQPYTCLLVYPKKDARASTFETTYDTEGCRRIDVRDPAKFKSDVYFTDDAILAYTGISWSSFATLIPADGATWEFESLFWGPTECAWNGLKTIHGRSLWGRFVFEMPEAARVKILKDQICKAVVSYKNEKKSGHGHVGLIPHWLDEEVGDPRFYDQCVKPLVDELDAVVACVKVDMTDDDVKDVAERYLAKLVDFRFIVDRMRADYLRKAL